MRIAIGILFAVTVAACGEAGSARDGRDREFSAPVERCISLHTHSASGYTRADLLALFDPSQASIENVGYRQEGENRWPMVIVRIPRIAEGYFHPRMMNPVGENATCRLYRRRGVWNMA